MNKIVLAGFLVMFGWVVNSQAVVISWSSTGLLTGTASAQLVYVSNNTPPTYNGSWSVNASPLATASGGAVDVPYLYDQTTSDDTGRSDGRYYVVLFNTGSTQYAVSTDWLAYNDPKLGTSEFDPPSTFYANNFGTWQNVPEPSAAALLCLGAAAAALRRRKRA